MNSSARLADVSDARARLATAEEFADTATALYDLSSERAQYPDVYVTNAVHCGIAAADAICIVVLGRYSASGNHDEATRLLKSVDKGASVHLRRLLSIKTKAGYSPSPASAHDVQIAHRSHLALLETARAAMADR